MRLQGKVALVTGGGSGIGRAICERFAAEEACVAVGEINADSGRETATRIVRGGGKAEFIQTDVSNEESIIAAVGKTVSAFGKLNVLVNNAAAFVIKDVTATAGEWEVMLQTNILGTAFCVKHAAPDMTNVVGGDIVDLRFISLT